MALLEANDNGYASFLFCIESLALRAEAFYRCIKEAEVSPFLKSSKFGSAIPRNYCSQKHEKLGMEFEKVCATYMPNILITYVTF